VVSRIFSLRDELKEFVGAFEPSVYPGTDAAVLVGVFAEIERAAAAGKLLAARRVEETKVHQSDGHKTAGTWLASLTGEPVGQAIADLEGAREIVSNSDIREAFQSGDLSEAQARQIASATARCPSQAADLVKAATEMEFSELKKRCRDARFSSGSPDEEISRQERIRKDRYLRMWLDQEGAGHIEARVTPDAFGVIKTAIEGAAKGVFEDARKDGRREPQKAYLADALVILCSGAGSVRGSKDTRLRPLMRLRVDVSALKRGHAGPGEVCQIPGIDAPVPVAAARELIGDALLELIVTEGTDVRSVVTDTRHVARALQIALEERDSVCCVPGCTQTTGLERDHWQTDYIAGGKTCLDNLAMLCPYHHDQKTHRGWRLEGPPGRWRFTGPDGNEARGTTNTNGAHGAHGARGQPRLL
jgi:hypothetical protein